MRQPALPARPGRRCRSLRHGMLAAVLAVATLASQAADYRFVDLGTLGGNFSRATGISDAGTVVGTSATLDIAEKPMRWTSRRGMVALGPPARWGHASAVNTAGVIVGATATANGNRWHAARWHGSKVVDLGTLGGRNSHAYGINDAGWVVGDSHLPDDTTVHPALWRDGVVIDLGTLGGADGEASAINELGWIAGTTATAEGYAHATLWIDGVPTDLGTLGGFQSRAHAINNAGAVVGCGTGAIAGYRAALWVDGAVKDLGGLGERGSCALGINDAGLIVGQSYLPEGKSRKGQHAVLWDADGIHDLNDLIDKPARQAGWVLNAAYAINADGAIVGWARNKLTGVDVRAFLLKPR